MSGFAVAVHARPDRVLLAAAGPDGIRLLAAAPGGTDPATAVADFFGDRPPAVVVRVGATPGGAFPGSPRVEAVPVAVAALAVGPAPRAGPVVVAETWSGRTGVVVVRDGAVEPVARAQSLGATALAAGAVEIVLLGEPESVASAPCPVRPAGPVDPDDPDDPAAVAGAGPDTAAVLGAALLGAGLLATAEPEAGVVRPGPCTVGDRPHRPHRPHRPRLPRALRRAALPAAVLLGTVLLGAGLLAGDPGPGRRPGPPAEGIVVQYGYAAALPAGWEHTGGDPIRRRILLSPVGRPDGAELVVVERSPLAYDAGREPDRARRELAAGLAGARGVTRPQAGAAPGTHRYRQEPGDGTVVDWLVLFTGTDQLVVGCRRPMAAEAPAACAEVAGSLRLVR
ncbi:MULTISPECIES: type VII secretion-associated protein [Pseudonocardia]|uniref:Type VII secretion-associated protein n=2 Tax=Pseudonocardia TaxID=1847 RepID=A0A1Y2N0N7_PSEAH|nr:MULTISPECIES: type VII secretion-associated protein [Pseudonocardia]OSY41034.1 hypothetical protein BG845_02376 [Pseudonocardia autotrophica]TDN73838.1 type VII secretion-associated protein (TIGR03931 family) [Pseudonocardia autotrophica]BBG04585.1 hypothetical protein Pdca_57940 [Pseudonocardia autotrophica]GEC25713.1 hypothetical protein PSA01_27420 [Pseudonocardia saturnea]